MKNFEQKLYDEITISARQEFDYSDFIAGFDIDDEYIADKLIWEVINRMIINTPKERISHELYNELLMAGHLISIESLKEFVEDKDVVFKKQIDVAKLATQMLNNGVDELAVYSNMIKLL
jgi:hypothetical protein